MNSRDDQSAVNGAAAAHPGDSRDTVWTARRLQAVVLVYVLLIFLAFIALSLFVFHSPDAVKPLALAGVATCFALLPQVLGKIEYRAGKSGVRKRFRKGKGNGPFKDVFLWKDLSHVVMTRGGFKYFQHLAEPSALRRFVKLQLSDRYSGEVHVEPKDRDRIIGLLNEKNIVVRKS